MRNTQKKPFFQRTWVMILLLLFVAPLGIYLIWKNCPRWHPVVKAGLSVIFGLIWLGAVVGNGGSTEPSKNIPQEVVNTEQVTPSEEPDAKTAEGDAEDPDGPIELNPSGAPQELIPVESDDSDPEPAPDRSTSSSESDSANVSEQTQTPAPEPEPTSDPESDPEPAPSPDRSSGGSGNSSGGSGDGSSGGGGGSSGGSGGGSSGSSGQSPAPPISTSWAYVGSSESNKYHYPSCGSAKNILPENLVGWNTVEEAQAAGYKPCGRCHPPA